MAKVNPILIKEVNDRVYRWGPWSTTKSPRRTLTRAMQRELDYRKHEAKAKVLGRATRSAETKAKINNDIKNAIKNANKVRTSGNSTEQRINNSLPHPNTRGLPPSPNAAQNPKNIQNNSFYKSVSSWVKDNPKTAYSTIASLFAAPILYSMFGDSEDTPSDTVPKGTNADTNNYKLLANKAKQDINKEYAAARNRTTGTNKGTYPQSATEAETPNRIQEQQANQKLPQNPQLGNVWDTSSADIGIFDAPNNYTPILPNNPILPHTSIDINNGTNNLAENVVNTSVGQGTTQGAATPEKKETPATGTNKGTNNAVNENTQSSVTPDYLTEFYKKFDKKYNYDPAKGRFNIWL